MRSLPVGARVSSSLLVSPPLSTRVHSFQPPLETGHRSFELPSCPFVELRSSVGFIVSPQHLEVRYRSSVYIYEILKSFCIMPIKEHSTQRHILH